MLPTSKIEETELEDNVHNPSLDISAFYESINGWNDLLLLGRKRLTISVFGFQLIID